MVYGIDIIKNAYMIIWMLISFLLMY